MLHPQKTLLQILWLLVLLSFVVAQTNRATKLLVISVDGLDYRYLRDADKLGLKIPNLRKLLREGEVTAGIEGVYPTVTWPSHTTLISGIAPAQHGILGNRRPTSEGGDYYWEVNLLKTKTLWHATQKAGLKSAAITWPVTVNAAIDFNLPEYFQRRNGGEYYTPRPLIRTMIQVVAPRIGERIYDGACGSAGFLCEAFDYLKAKTELTTSDLDTLQTRTFYGKEKKSLAYVIAIMNMILHGIEAPNIIHTNTLTENIADIQDKDRFDTVLANPPFGGKERKEVQQNFPIRTGETAFLFLQHFIKILRAGGRGGIVIKNTFLSNTDNASVSLRKLLLESCNLHTVLDELKKSLLHQAFTGQL